MKHKDTKSTKRPEVWCSLALVLLLSCASPFLESARDPQGLSGGLGVVAVGAAIPGFDTCQFSDHFAVMPVADARYGFNVFSLSLQLGAGYAQGRDYPENYLDPFDSTGVFCASAYASARYYVGQEGALRLSVGAFGTPPSKGGYVSPSVNLSYLHDFGRTLTFSASIGSPMLVGLGLVYHLHLGRHVTAHVSGGTSTILSAGAGLGVDFVGNPKD